MGDYNNDPENPDHFAHEHYAVGDGYQGEDFFDYDESDEMTWWQRVRTFEPALLRGVLSALAVVLATVGVDASGVFEQVNVAWAAIFGVIPLVQAWWTRGSVTPVAKQK